MNRKNLSLIVSILMLCGVVTFLTLVAWPRIAMAEPSPTGATIASDYPDYVPGATVTLTGAGWQPGEAVHIFVNDDAGRTWSHNSDPDPFADDSGSFIYQFRLPTWFVANYTVTATGPLSGTATTAFTDLSIGTYDQCSNDLGSGYTSGDIGCRWINGNLQGNNSYYAEGDATVQRLWLTGFSPGTTHTVTIKYGTTKGGKHAYDFLTTWDWSEDWIRVADRCQGITGCEAVPETTLDIPQDPNVPDSFEPSASGARQFVMRGGTLNSATTPAIVSGDYADNSETIITVDFTVAASGDLCPTSGSEAGTCGVVIWFGAHVATQANWGLGMGAGSISGSPYHVALDKVDRAPVGERDNQMQANAVTVIPPGWIIIAKDAVPNDPQDFSFNLNNNSTISQDFLLDDDGDNISPGLTLSNNLTFEVPPGTWYATEIMPLPTGWTLANLDCIDPTSNTTVNGAVATINLASEETVTCTYTDSRDQGSLKISKVFDPLSSGFSGKFTINYDCDDGVAHDGAAELAAGEFATISGIPTGTSCTVSESTLPTAPDDWTFGVPSISPEQPVTITSTTTPVEVTVTNTITRDQGYLKISKVLDPMIFTFDGNFSIGYNCGGGDQMVELAAGASMAIGPFDTGTSCTVSEPALPTPPTGWTFGAPSISGSPATIIKGDQAAAVEVTVTNTITRDFGSLKITKTLSNPDGAPVPPSFAVNYSCDNDGTLFGGTVSVVAGISQTVSGIPTGSTCTVTEVAPEAIPGYTWSPITYSPESVTIETKDGTFEIVVGNAITRDRGNLEISKILSNPDGAPVPASFAVNYSCDNDGTLFGGTVNVAAGSSQTVSGIPTGYTCTITEVAPTPIPGYTWADVTYDPQSIEISAKDTTFTVTAVNAILRDRGRLEIIKTVTGGSFNGSFDVHVVCTGDGGTYNPSISFPDPGFVVIENIPTGNECTVTEPILPTPPVGYAWAPPVITGSPAVISKGTTAEVTVANKLAQDLTVTKTAVPTFTRTWDWTITKDFDATYNLLAGQSVTHGYKVTVTPTHTDRAWQVVGTLTISNPNSWQAIEANVSDATNVGGTCVLDDPTQAVVTVPASNSVDVNYTCTWASAPGNYSGTNTATVTWDKNVYSTPGDTASGTKDFEFANPIEVNPTITVEDDNMPGEFWNANRAALEMTYTREFTCSTTANYVNGKYSYSHTNTATITGTDLVDTATVNVNCFAPKVTKTAATYWNRDWDWTITKDFDAAYNLFSGDTVTHGYQVTVTPEYTDNFWGVTGTITVYNYHPTTDMTLTSLTDLAGGINADVTCDSLVVPAAGSLTCTYDTGEQDSPDENPFGDLNTATAVFAGADWTGTYPIVFSATPSTEDDPVITVDDDNLTGETWSADRVSGEWTYTRPFACSTDPAYYTDGKYSYSHTNTATIEETEQSDDATVDVTCYWPQIELTKTGDELSKISDFVYYDITLFNNTPDDTGLRALSCSISDLTIPYNEIVELISGAKDVNLDIEFTIPDNASDPFVNTASVTCQPVAATEPVVGDSTFSVSDSASWSTELFQPAVEIIKVGPLLAISGDPTLYNFTINNLSSNDSPNLILDNLADDKLGDLADDAPAACDELAPGASCTFTAPFIHNLDDPLKPVDITNIVTVHYHPDGFSNDVSDTDDHTLKLLPPIQATDSSLCIYDRDPDRNGQQFRLLYTQDPQAWPSYKVTATNPGQFFYNVFAAGTPGELLTFNITLPYPFVTQGANPLHGYPGVTTYTNDSDQTCFMPEGEFFVDSTQVTLVNYLPDGDGFYYENLPGGEDGDGGDSVSTYTIKVTVTVPASGFVYVNLHLDYGLKGTGGFGKDGYGNAVKFGTGTDPIENPFIYLVPQLADHTFTVSVNGAQEDSTYIENGNTFKRNPGVGGLSRWANVNRDPVVGATITLKRDNILVSTTLTDEDGWYQIYYKHIGRPTIYTVTISKDGHTQTRTVTLKANGFVQVDFDLLVD